MDEILNLIESVSEGFPSYFFYNRLFYKLKLFTLMLEVENDGKANQVVFCNSLT